MASGNVSLKLEERQLPRSTQENRAIKKLIEKNKASENLRTQHPDPVAGGGAVSSATISLRALEPNDIQSIKPNALLYLSHNLKQNPKCVHHTRAICSEIKKHSRGRSILLLLLPRPRSRRIPVLFASPRTAQAPLRAAGSSVGVFYIFPLPLRLLETFKRCGS